jgi:uncharacterized membrane protein
MKVTALLLSLLFFIIGLTHMTKPGTVLAQDKRKAFSIRPIPGEYNKKVIPGEENTLHLEVHNIGNIAITNIRLSTEIPDDWKIEVDPTTIDHLSVGGIQTVNLSVVPVRKASRDRYQITVIGDTNEIKRVSSLYVRVDMATSVWTWIGAAITLAVIAVFIYVFKRFGR